MRKKTRGMVMEYDVFFGPTVKTSPYVRKNYNMEEKQTNDNPKKLNRKNPWGSRSYADLITQAIEASPEKRLTLSQIYEWMIRNIPFFSDQAESNSSAGWKQEGVQKEKCSEEETKKTEETNSIRHNLSLHKKFLRSRNDGTGKSSWWTVDEKAGLGRTPRRKGIYKRRKGKGIVHHNQVEKFSSLARNGGSNLFSNGKLRQNLWLNKSSGSSWNGLQYGNEKHQFHSNQHLNPLGNLPSFSALCNDRSFRANFNLSTEASYQSEQLFISTTSSLKTETSSYGSSHSSYQAYHQDIVLLPSTSFQHSKNNTTSTEYFMSPHHLSGSSITTDLGRNTMESDTNNFRNTVPEPSSSEDETVLQILLQESDISNEGIDFLLDKELQDNSVDLSPVLEDLSETKNCNLNYRDFNHAHYSSVVSYHNSIENHSESKNMQGNKEAKLFNEGQSETADNLNKELANYFKSTIINSTIQGKRNHFSETENISVTLRNNDLYDFSIESILRKSENSVLFSDENKRDDLSIPLNLENSACNESGNNVVDEIIQKLYSPCPDTSDSLSEMADTSAYQLSSTSPETTNDNEKADTFISKENPTTMPLNFSDLSPYLYQNSQQFPRLENSEVHDNVDIECKNFIGDRNLRRQSAFCHRSNSASLEEIVQKIKNMNDSVDGTRKTSENQRNSSDSESSSPSLHENQNINLLLENKKNEESCVNDVFMDSDYSIQKSPELLLIESVNGHSETKPESYASILEETLSKFKPDSEVLTHYDVDAYFSSCHKIENPSSQNGNIIDQNFNAGDGQCLNLYSNDANRDESSMDTQNIQEPVSDAYLNSDHYSDTTESSNLSQNSLYHQALNDNFSDTIENGSNQHDFSYPGSKMQIPCLYSEYPPVVSPNAHLGGTRASYEMSYSTNPLMIEGDQGKYWNIFHNNGTQNSEDSVCDMDQSSSDNEIYENFKKSFSGSSSDVSSEFLNALNDFDEYQDILRRSENGDPGLLCESSNSNQDLDFNLPEIGMNMLKIDDNSEDENRNLDINCNLDESYSQQQVQCPIDDSLYQYLRTGIKKEFKNFFDLFDFKAPDPEADSKDDKKTKNKPNKMDDEEAKNKPKKKDKDSK